MSGMYGWWPFHTITGSVPDLSGAGNDATANGATRGVGGRGGLQAFSFNGSGDFVGTPISFSSTRQHSITLAFWLREGSSGDSTGRYISADLSDYFSVIRGGSAGTVSWKTRDSSGNLTTTQQSITLDEWTHVAGVLNTETSTQRLYINGQEVSNANASSSFGTGNVTRYLNIGIGSESNSQNTAQSGTSIEGEMCDVRYYGRALSSDEIQTLYEWGSGDYTRPADDTDGGVHYYDADSNTTDQWGSSNASLSGSASYTGGVRGSAFDVPSSSSDAVDLGFTTLELPMSVSLWFKYDTTAGFDEIFSNFQNGSDDLYVGLSGGDAFFTHDAGGVSTSTWSTSANIWYHTAMTIGNGELRGYRNGTIDLVTSDSSSTTNVDNGATFKIGSGNNDFNSLAVDDVRIYNRVLKPREVYKLYRYGTFGIDMREKTVNAR